MVQDWWDYHHEGKEKYSRWLTGSAGPEVWKYLNISNYIVQGSVVLNIGVGMGYCTREPVRRKCVVHALAISPEALKKVESVVEKTWLPSCYGELPKQFFDLTILNLVTQHMKDEDLESQVAVVVTALKPTGVFAKQFDFAIDDV